MKVTFKEWPVISTLGQHSQRKSSRLLTPSWLSLLPVLKGCEATRLGESLALWGPRLLPLQLLQNLDENRIWSSVKVAPVSWISCYAGTSRALRCLPTLGGETGDDFCRAEEETEAELKKARQVSKRAVVFSREGEIEEVERPITSSVGEERLLNRCRDPLARCHEDMVFLAVTAIWRQAAWQSHVFPVSHPVALQRIYSQGAIMIQPWLLPSYVLAI